MYINQTVVMKDSHVKYWYGGLPGIAALFQLFVFSTIEPLTYFHIFLLVPYSYATYLLIAASAGSQYKESKTRQLSSILICYFASLGFCLAVYDSSSYKMLIAYTTLIWLSLAYIVEKLQVARLIHIYETTLDSQREVTMLQAFKNHIDPHFLYNSLNTLSYLIRHESSKAYLFIDALCNTYNQILKTKEDNLIPIMNELSIASDYIQMMKIRFGEESITYTVVINEFELSNIYIPPCSLQFILENCFKHNIFNENQPMQIEIILNDNYLQVTNDRRPKKTNYQTHGTGIRNLEQRMALITGKKPEINITETAYIAKIPLIKN